MLKIACLSDIHGMWDKIDYPKADVLCLAGDILANYSRNRKIDAQEQLKEIVRLNDFLGKLKEKGVYKEILVGFGNHDFSGEMFPEETAKLFTNAHYRHDSSILVEGVKFYLSAWSSWFWSWAFNLPEDDEEKGYPVAKKIWSKIDNDTQVLITHGPAKGINDKCRDGREVGCPILRERIKELKSLKLFVTGHIHIEFGNKDVEGIKCVNASACNEDYQPVNPIQVFDLEVNNATK